MGNVQHITRFLTKTCPHANGEWQDRPYAL